MNEWWELGGLELGATTHATDNGVMTCEMSLALLAAEDLVRVQVDVVCEPHPRRLSAAGVGRVGEMSIEDGFLIPSCGDPLIGVGTDLVGLSGYCVDLEEAQNVTSMAWIIRSSDK